MPMTHYIQDGLLTIDARGAIDFDGFSEAWERILSGPASQSPAYALLDLRDASVDLTGQEIETIVSRLSINPPFEKIAIRLCHRPYIQCRGQHHRYSL